MKVSKRMVREVVNYGLDGSVVEIYHVCLNCGFIGWMPDGVCPHVEYFGKCEPRDPEDLRKPRDHKYRKTHPGQVNLRGQNLRKVFWGKEGR